ncbi:hypothetical protein KFL_004960090 [Klebsormidium nitens]|uniref:Uncharacterized protein n=1 Tax=Klebsormidium nitens TaxID=105231 RepID=A0A1Y1II70_KLENI|nr:hypothetical protein KFL_004960090 [Klebsormidium nitens]|eukprot:GAQ89199.1 hypothetical protein KFL_004960090 [Klebsormidium nitens]
MERKVVSEVETDEPAESRDSDAHSITVASGNSALEQTKFIPVGGENLRPSENPTPEYADSGRVGVSRTPTDHCSNGESDGCRASVLRSLRVNVLVESLRLHRWGFWTASDADEADSDAAASDLDADADWNSMSSDEVDLFFPDEGEYEDSDGATGETVILQLQA